MDIDDLGKIIQHFTHPHPLELTILLRQASSYNLYECYCCASIYTAHTSSSSVIMYACKKPECRYQPCRLTLKAIAKGARGVYLCVLCAELEESVERHVLHPNHPRLILVSSCMDGECDACMVGSWSPKVYSYFCDTWRCGFQMHVKCAHSLKPTMAVTRNNHRHLLTLIAGHDHLRSDCDFCHRKISSGCAFLRCVPCNLNYHIYCDGTQWCSVQRLIMYPRGHPQHPLSLSGRENESYWSCNVCSKKREWPAEYVYSCLECNNFTAHVSCVFESLPCPFSCSVTVSNIVDMMIKDGGLHEAAQCQGCKKRFLDGLSVYGCQHCNFYVHESCKSRLLLQQQQPMVEEEKEEKMIISRRLGYDVQRNSPLVLVFAHGKDFTCACCDRRCSGFVFRGEDIVLDVECMLLMPSTFLELTGHEHHVALLQKGNATKNSYLRCLPCRKNFNINEPSCRFPLTILHECHFHPLTLVLHPPENNNVDDQCYCDVCEDKRDPNEGLYYCVECQFEVHIACVKSEVLRLSSNKPEDVKFVTIQEITQNEKAKKKKIKVRDVFRLKEELQHSYARVAKELDEIFSIASKITWQSLVPENPFSKNESKRTLYSDDPFKKFIEDLNSSFVLKKMSSILKSLMNEEVVRIGEYLVPMNFDESVLETLFHKYGDLGVKCTFSQAAKQCIFVGICKTLQSMCDTKVVRVTKNLLVEWWTWFAMGKAAGFEVQFGFEILERVVYAHFGLEADYYAVDEFTNVRKEISELPKKIELLKRELDEAKRKLEGAVKKESQLREEAFRVKKSALMKKCLMEAEDLVCCSVGEMLFPSSSSE